MSDLVSPLQTADSGAPITPASVSPAPGVSTPPPAAAASPSEAPALPKNILRMGPIMALVAGNPPAVSASLKNHEDRDDIKEVRKHADALKQAGFGFYKSLSGQFGVLFNRFHIHGADIQAADKAGKLLQIAPPWDAVEHEVSKSGLKHPSLLATGLPGGFANPTPQAAVQASAGISPGGAPSPIKQTPAGVQRKAMIARLQAMQPGSPTSGPAPGAGRLLNQILKPVV